MSDAPRTDEFLAPAREIGNALLDAAQRDGPGMYWSGWDSTGASGSPRTVRPPSFDLYLGNAGIALFLLHLAQEAKDERYLDAARRALEWGLESAFHSDDYSFHTGRLGLSYVLLKLAAVAQRPGEIQRALDLAEGCGDFLRDRTRFSDFLAGASGALLGLGQLHAATADPGILDLLWLGHDVLLDRATPAKNGLYWDSIPTAVAPLCGFAHGPAGVGHTALELGRYLGSEALFLLAREAFLYEDQWYDPTANNWMDLRVAPAEIEDRNEAERRWRQGDREYFTRRRDTNVWCHGAAGIGLARLRAFELWGDASYREDVERALNRTRAAHHRLPSFCLCHGGGGNADLFLEVYRCRHDSESLDVARQMARAAVASRTEQGYFRPGFDCDAEDPGLMMGNAGIGYFLLRAGDPETTPSILAPRIRAEPIEVTGKPIARDLPSARARILRRVFPRTLAELQRGGPDHLQQHLRRPATARESEIPAFLAFAENHAAECGESNSNTSALGVAMRVERSRLTLANPESRWRQLVAEQISRKQFARWNALPDGARRLSTIRPMDSLQIWPANELGIPDTDFVAVFSGSQGAQQMAVPQLGYEILTEFREESNVAAALERFSSRFGGLSTADAEQVQRAFWGYLKEFLRRGVLQVTTMAATQPDANESRSRSAEDG